MEKQPPNVKAIFDQALEIEGPAERTAYLSRACAEAPEVRRQVEALLRAYAEAGSFLEPPAAAPVATVDEPISERPGTVIGPYKLMEQIGEGGMGLVFVAEQQQPLRRKVALKLIKPGMDTRQVIARFEAERQALALMDHPNIAKVLDGGATNSGRPYFVMELVKGVPITQFCDDNRLTPRERLALFVSVCQAVQHAHQKGIIHRDLKPSNVLVSSHDGTPVVKVIDFGVAKAIGQQLTDKTVYTQLSQLVGTPLYMSPEQAGQSGLDVDTRTDIYALGVLLYELLTGTTPFDRERFREAGYDELRRIIREEEPPKPSTRISTLGQAATTVSTQRKSDPRRLSQLFRGELDWIVMKCLEKDRNRRYETANGLARDLQRYLHDEPVEACPPSAGYRLRKFARKYKKFLATAAAFVLLLIVGVVASTWQAVRATRAQGEARQAEGEARAAEERAKIEAAISQVANAFVQDDLLGQADVEMQGEPDRNVKVLTLLDRAAKKVEGRYQDQPEVEAAVRLTIGNAYRATGGYAKAQPHLDRALEIRRRVLPPDHPDTLAALNGLARLYLDQQAHLKAELLLVEVVEVSRRTLGAEHPATLTALHNLGRLHMDRDRVAEAEAVYVEVLEARRRVLGVEHPETLRSQHNRAAIHAKRGQLAQAEALYLQTLEACRRVLGGGHPLTLICTNNLAGHYWKERRQYDKAEPLYLQAVEDGRRALGVRHPDTLRVLGNLAQMYVEQRQYAKAELLWAEAAPVLLVLWEEDPRGIAGLRAHQAALPLVRLYVAQGELNLLREKKYAEAEPALRVLLRFNLNPWLKPHAKGLLGECLAGQQKYTDAEPLLLASYEDLRAAGATIPLVERKRLSEALGRIVQFYEARGKAPQAAEWRKKLEDEKQRQARRDAALAQHGRGEALARQGKTAEAEAAFREAVRLEPDCAEAHRALGEVLCYQKHDFNGAVAAFREAVRLEPKNLANHCNLSNAFSRRGDRVAAEAAYREVVRLEPWREAGVRRQARLNLVEVDYREALRLRPNDIAALIGLGNTLVQQFKGAEAEPVLREALLREPANAALHCALGKALLYQRQGVAAVAAFREALRLKPDHAEAHCGLGNALNQQEKWAEAEAEFREALRLEPKYADAYSGLGSVLLRRKPAVAEDYFGEAARLLREGEAAAAEAEYRKALRLRPAFPEAHVNVGRALTEQGKLREAEDEFRQALDLDPECGGAYTWLGIVYQKQREPAEAEADARNAARLAPAMAQVHVSSGKDHAQQRRLAEAETAFRQALRLKPDYADACSNLGALLGQRNDLDGAIAVCREAVRLDPAHSEAHYNLGKVLSRQGKWAEAEVECRTAVHLNPDSADAHHHLGEVLDTQGKWAGAEDAYRKAIRLKPSEFLWHYSLGYFLSRQGKLAEAAVAYRRALDLAPLADAFRSMLGKSLFDQRKLAEAEGVYRDGLRLKPAEAWMHWQLGLVLREQGRLAEALTALKKGRELGYQLPGQPKFVDEQVTDCEDLIKLDAQLPAILRGEVRPKNVGEQVAFARVCALKRHYATAARFYQAALQPGGARNFYDGACVAALAGCGMGEGADKLDEAERARWRKQALDWLRADLAMWETLVKSNARYAAPFTLGLRKGNQNLAALRDAAALSKLPEAERAEWQKFWADLEALIQKALKRD